MTLHVGSDIHVFEGLRTSKILANVLHCSLQRDLRQEAGADLCGHWLVSVTATNIP